MGIDSFSRNTKIAKNSTLLYIRMAIVMAINLYSVRIVLHSLGEVDYGIYNVLSGVITLLSCITSTTSTSTQRFYSFTIGEDKQKKIQDIFSISINIYIVLSAFVIIVGETIGLWFINTKLTIPSDRLIAANWVYQFSILSFIFSILQSPFSAATIANEDMGFFAIVSLLECCFKLIIAIILASVSVDKLIFYAAALMLVPLLSLGIYIIIAYIKYPECRYKKISDKRLYKEIMHFSGWSLYGSVAGVGMNQVVNILINMYFGPIANAARGISMQVNSAFSSFGANFITAIRPPMIKSFAEGNFAYLDKLFSVSNKLIFYSMIIIAIPVYAEMEGIIHLWLNNDEIMIIKFSRLIVIYIMILVLNNPISIIMQATGKVKEYFVPVESMTLLCPFVSWFLFKFGAPVYSAFWAMIVAVSISHIIRIFTLKKYYPQFSIKKYICKFIIPAILISIIVYCVACSIRLFIGNLVVRIVTLFVIASLLVTSLVYVFNLTKNERTLLKNYLHKIINKLDAKR